LNKSFPWTVGPAVSSQSDICEWLDHERENFFLTNFEQNFRRSHDKFKTFADFGTNFWRPLQSISASFALALEQNSGFIAQQ
jgi:hypothetical protein